MIYWDGYRWTHEPGKRPVPRAPRSRLRRIGDWILTLAAIIGLMAVAFPFDPASAAVPSLSLTPPNADVGSTVDVSGATFPAKVTVQIELDGSTSGMPKVKVSPSGTIKTSFIVPEITAGSHLLGAEVLSRGGRRAAPSLGTVLATVTLIVTDPTATPATTASPPATATAATAAATPTPTAVPTPTSTPLSTPAPTPTPTAAPTATPIPAATPPGPSFRDDFDGTALDPSKWWRETRWDGDTRWQTWCSWSDDPRLYSVSGGVLTLSALRVNGAEPYICPIISTRGKFEQTQGIWRARLKWDRGHALWPAFWLHNTPNTVDEIDVLEAYPEPTHPNYYATTTHWVGGQRGADQTAPDTDWHVYEVEWRGTTTTYRRDGVVVATISSPIADVPMFTILNLMVGVHFNGTAPDATTPDAPRLMVDWVEVLP